MPKTRYIGYVVASIDGRISIAAGTVPDWTSREDWNFLQKSLARADAVVVGRNTYLTVADRLRKRNTFVLSTRPKTMIRRGRVTFINPATMDIRALLKQYRVVAVVGGAMVYRYMVEHNLLDELFVTIEPLIFGRGQPMVIDGTKTTRLQLGAVKKLNRSGTLLLHYLRTQTYDCHAHPYRCVSRKRGPG